MWRPVQYSYKNHRFQPHPDLLLHFIAVLYTRREESNIFANSQAKWVLPPQNTVEHPEVMRPCFCHIIPLSLKSHHSKSSWEVILNGAEDVCRVKSLSAILAL
ncbi:hypothetical protein ILYODFUR_032825 [Ilyodon furcidens]|uniref:Uncharacterized protein n=1 Tax=Ilyodon furcidens TaxID=33524 RepID=A0ABV0UPS6_9TELE